MVVLIRASPRGLRFSLSPREPRGGQKPDMRTKRFLFRLDTCNYRVFHVNYVSFLFVLGPVNVIFALLSTA